MSANASPDPLPPLTSQDMLGGLIAIVSPILIVIQIVLFFTVRWMAMQFVLYPSGTGVDWSINPWIVWLPVFVLSLAVVQFMLNRKSRVPKLHKRVVWGSLAVGIIVAAIGLSLTPPPNERYVSPEDRQDWPRQLQMPSFRY